MIRLQLAGRFGNHLFQWATAMCMQSNNRSVILTFDEFHQSTPSPFLYQLVEGTIEIRKSNFTGRLLQMEDKYLSQSQLLKSLIYTEDDPYGISEEAPRGARIMRGYFQNWQNFAKVDQEVSNRLNSQIENWTDSKSELKKLKARLGKFHAVHVRQGDYSGTEFGTLSAEYYARNTSKLSSPVVVFTDHENLSDEYLEAIKPDFIITPKTLSAEDTFALMSHADSITLANSTFSWWAGLLISKKGGKVVVPDPWLKKGYSGNGLIYPGMRAVEGIFNSI